MENRTQRKMIEIRNTRFIFHTNFSGEVNQYGSNKRTANVIINDIQKAQELMAAGFNVKMTQPMPGREDEFKQEYYIQLVANYDSAYPPKIYHVNPAGRTILLDKDTVGIIDTMRVRNLNVMANDYEYQPGKHSLYIRTMYVEQDVESDPYYGDPFYKEYHPEEFM